MTRIRTKKSSKYFTISNSTAQDNSLSFGALGLLTYCLSMPEEWDFHPQVIWKLRDCGRDKCYAMFNELIQSYHCIRIRKPNPKAKHLPGEIEYEIFDEVEDCKARIKELEKTEKFLEHGGNFKKCFRHPSFQDPKEWDPKSQDTEKPYLLKETETEEKKQCIKKKQQCREHEPPSEEKKQKSVCSLSTHTVSVPSDDPKLQEKTQAFNWFLQIGCDVVSAKYFVDKYSSEEIKQASGYVVKQIQKKKSKNEEISDVIGYLRRTLENKWWAMGKKMP